VSTHYRPPGPFATPAASAFDRREALGLARTPTLRPFSLRKMIDAAPTTGRSARMSCRGRPRRPRSCDFRNMSTSSVAALARWRCRRRPHRDQLGSTPPMIATLTSSSAGLSSHARP
jgi:hypothetical protein